MTELFEKLSRLQWLLRKQQLKTFAAGGPMADTSRGQGRILAVLRMKDGISTKDLSYLLGIRVSSLNELLAKLEKGGYITRNPSEADRRVMLIHLTEKGREEEEPEQDVGGVFSCLSSEERLAFGEYLDRIIAALEAELGTDEERDGLSEWMAAARMRMGDEQFEELMSMRGNMRSRRGGFGDGRFGGGFPGFGFNRRHAWPNDADSSRPSVPEQPHDGEGKVDR
ncbi:MULTISPECIES: MarR family transcriptional regulator [unclassified Paenibacillus]|uniref:MarR family winged helix-turn-helix transcriptional regulator n=1 Tax=unclassified Paenibacillus TaxID=185978 RepID=UPI000953E396|nr:MULTISPECIES: MarR family transcriptional regulator [unclassified Paenibacillus]ASS68332.1 MarR family transcriptional regulator [Paenibacillus sp. RUD330]SIR29326.1 DNA-binding transcriptional regulator, MarR family [Paenibacillus sp. RU4X]SIR41453.1 DNA-binding transcriptional regulator, MarR family [Paenibacillus sp. RU4T]